MGLFRWDGLRPSFLGRLRPTPNADVLTRFAEDRQPAIRRLVARHERLADLAASYPALLFALAITDNKPLAAQIEREVIAGRPLAELSAAGDVPYWLRKLPPEAFEERLPKLPDDVDFRRKIANLVPEDAGDTANWLRMLGQALQFGDRDFAVWLARETKDGDSLCDRCVFRRALYAWFSNRPDTKAGKLIATRWHPTMSLETVNDAVAEWSEDLTVYLYLPDTKTIAPWLTPRIIDGLSIEPVLTARDLIDDARIMDNCLRTYADQIAGGTIQIWRAVKDGRHVAHLSIGHQNDDPLPSVWEIHGPKNSGVDEDVFRAVRRWFYEADVPDKRPGQKVWDDVEVDRDAWRALWRPYWLAKKQFPDQLPLTPSRDIVDTF